MYCHAGCSTDAVVAALGLTLADLYDTASVPTGSAATPNTRPATGADWTPCGHGIAQEYRYVDEDGALLYVVVRCPVKDFAQYRPDPTKRNGRAWKLGNVRRVLYRLPDVAAAVAAGRTVYVVEGEKDVDRLWSLGQPATCNPHGGGKWRDEYAVALTGATVVIVADRDPPLRKRGRVAGPPPGYEHAVTVAASLATVGATVTVVEAAQGKDVSDHLDAGLALDALVPIDPAQRSRDAMTAAGATVEPEPPDEPEPTAVLNAAAFLTDQQLWPDGWDSDEPPADYELPPDRVVTAALREGRPHGIAAVLPEEFWARPVHQHIRQAAYSRYRSADAVMGAVLARLSAMVHHDLVLDFGIDAAPLNLFVGLYGPSGSSKSTAKRVANHLIIPPPYLREDFPDGIGIGSGEGLAELFMGTVEQEEDYHAAQLAGRRRPRVRTVRRQVRHNAFVYVDEGVTLTKLMTDRRGSILGEVIRSAWNGASLGQANAREESTRMIPEGSYSLGMAIGFQQEPAEKLLSGGDLGTPQRFTWLSALDPHIPHYADGRIDWPGPLIPGLTESTGEPLRGVIEPPEDIRTLVIERAAGTARGTERVDALDSQNTLMRCKLAALLAVLDQRIKVTDEDWELAGMVVATSQATRDRIVELARQRGEAEEVMRQEVAASRAVAVQAALTALPADVVRAADHIATKIGEKGPLTWRQIRDLFESKRRHLARPGLDHAITLGWVTTPADGVHALGGVNRE